MAGPNFASSEDSVDAQIYRGGRRFIDVLARNSLGVISDTVAVLEAQGNTHAVKRLLRSDEDFQHYSFGIIDNPVPVPPFEEDYFGPNAVFYESGVIGLGVDVDNGDGSVSSLDLIFPAESRPRIEVVQNGIELPMSQDSKLPLLKGLVEAMRSPLTHKEAVINKVTSLLPITEEHEELRHEDKMLRGLFYDRRPHYDLVLEVADKYFKSQDRTR